MSETPDHPVAIIDDDEPLRDALGVMFDAAGLDCIKFESAEDFLHALDEQTFSCAVIDVRLPGIDGMTLFRRLREKETVLPVVILTGHGDVPMAVEALKAGAVDFIEKPFDADRLLEGVREAIGRQAAAQEDHRAAEAARALVERLTPREHEVMNLMVMGHSNKAIAARLGISPRTVEVYRARIMEKMEARSLAELVRTSLRLNG